MGLLGFKEIVIIAVLMLIIWGVKTWNAQRKQAARADARNKRRKSREKHVQSSRDDE